MPEGLRDAGCEMRVVSCENFEGPLATNIRVQMLDAGGVARCGL
jgi:hypothetical protein